MGSKAEMDHIAAFLNSIRPLIFGDFNFSLKDTSSIDQNAKTEVFKAVNQLHENFLQSKKNDESLSIEEQKKLQYCPGKLEYPVVDEKLVQIKVDRNELNRRISSFITRKRKEVDETNAKEFCSRHFLEEDNPLFEEMNSCARVDAVFVPRSGCKSHVKVSRVDNIWGPQTVQPSIDQITIKQEPTENVTCPTLEDIEERLENMETHLKVKSDGSFRRSIYTRLKDLEERILFLEGLSPDYFHQTQMTFMSPKKRLRKEKVLSKCSVQELKQMMQDLKGELKHKSLRKKNLLFQH